MGIMAYGNPPAQYNYQPKDALVLFAEEMQAHSTNPYESTDLRVEGGSHTEVDETVEAVYVDGFGGDLERLVDLGVINPTESKILLRGVYSQVVTQTAMSGNSHDKRNNCPLSGEKTRKLSELTPRQQYAAETLPYSDPTR